MPSYRLEMLSEIIEKPRSQTSMLSSAALPKTQIFYMPMF